MNSCHWIHAVTIHLIHELYPSTLFLRSNNKDRRLTLHIEFYEYRYIIAVLALTTQCIMWWGGCIPMFWGYNKHSILQTSWNSLKKNNVAVWSSTICILHAVVCISLQCIWSCHVVHIYIYILVMSSSKSMYILKWLTNKKWWFLL